MLLLHLASTLFMVGVIWFVQVVHYPLFARIGPEIFPAYSDAHSRLTTYVVGPPMLLELSTGVLLLLFRPAGVPAAALWIGLALISVIWLSTALLQVPRHETLGLGFDATAHRALVATNWIRTAAWSARGALVLWISARLIS